MQKGFFTSKQTESKTRPDGKMRSCTICGMYKNVNTPRMKPYGNFKKRILNIGEAPAGLDDQRGIPWQGRSGKLLKKTYEKYGIDLFEDCLNINACWCSPRDKEGNDRFPTIDEVANCRKSTLRIIEEYKPQVIILLGNSAIFSLIGHRWKKDLGTIFKWRGWTIPDQDFHAWVCPTFHPNYIEQNDEGAERIIWEQDLLKAFGKLNQEIPIYKEPEIEIIEDLSLLEYCKIGSVKARTKPTRAAFDFETTGLKPHAEGHQIVCASVAYSADHAYAFMIPKTKNERLPFINFLTNPEIKKIAANMKYEHNWTSTKLRLIVEGWEWDTMQAAHVLDNREGITGLKFQTYVNFGVVDYDSEVSPYLQSVDYKNANSLNRVLELIEKPGGKELLMKYCAYDSINEYRLAMLQMERLNSNDPYPDDLPF